MTETPALEPAQISDGIAHLRLDRPPGNRISLAVMRGLRTEIDRLANPIAAGDVRAVLLTAAGPDFSHGADLADPELAEAMTGSADDRASIARLGWELIHAWASLPAPTVVAASGRAVGAGACLVLASDFRVLADDASLRWPEIDRGLSLAWGTVPRLVSELGPALARRLALLGEPVPVWDLPLPFAVRATTTAVDETARLLAGSLAAKPPLAVRATLAALRAAQDRLPFGAEREARDFSETAGSEDFAEAVAAFLEKRAGRYTGR